MLRTIALLGGFEVSTPMRGVCRTWYDATRTCPRVKLVDLLEMSTSTLNLRDSVKKRIDELPQKFTDHTTNDPMWITQEQALALVALPKNMFARLNVTTIGHSPIMRRYVLKDVVARALSNAGGVWALYARRNARREGRRLPRVLITYSTTQEQHIRHLVALFNDTNLPMACVPDAVKRELLCVMKRVYK